MVIGTHMALTLVSSRSYSLLEPKGIRLKPQMSVTIMLVIYGSSKIRFNGR